MLHTTSNPIFLTTPGRMRRGVALAMLAAVATFGAGTAHAKTPQRKAPHRYSAGIQTAPLSTSDGYPGVGGTTILAGTWRSPQFGNGALVDYVTITGQPSPTTLTFKGTEIAFLAQGTVRDTFTGTVTVRPDGIQNLSAKGRITGGTGVYRGASGRYKFKGIALPGSNAVGGGSSGTVSY